MYDVLIIGAGAAGLMAAKELSSKGKSVLVLEARSRLGGRIWTMNDSEFSFRLEAGAEFIHGKLSNTLSLLKEANIDYELVGGQSFQLHEGKIKVSDYFEYWDELLKKLKGLEKDEPIAEFMNKNFSEEKYSTLRKTVQQFVEGYDAADTTKASSKALYNEWKNEDDEHQYRIKDGYIKLIEYLANESKKAGAKIEMNKIVKEVIWKENECEVLTSNNEKYKACKIVCTVPIGVLQSDNTSRAYIQFTPQINEQIAAAKEIDFGGVIKIVIEFNKPFWEEIITGSQMQDLGFIFSEALIPTWWSQQPYNKNILTGWLGGPKALALKDNTDDDIFEKSIASLTQIFNCPEKIVAEQIKGWKVFNWLKDPFALGAYSYAKLKTAEAKKILEQPVQNTLFFAGEALYDGTQAGTVEGALASGKETAAIVLKSFS